jgi:pantoate--beta-alanine ligase
MHLTNLMEAKAHLATIREKKESIGTVHTLGALHEGHAILIRQSARENQHTIVTVYPNKIQLFPGLKYKFNLQEDVLFALNNGATAVISSNDEEMFPQDYRTFIDQGVRHSKLNSSIFSFASRGQVTGSIRWIIFTQPTRTYFGLKDIEQAILVKSAAKDLLIGSEIVYVPCIRFKNGVPISSRLMHQKDYLLEEVAALYSVLDSARLLIINGERKATVVLKFIDSELSNQLRHFSVLYTTIVETNDFLEIQDIEYPFIIHAAIRHNELTHFDGLFIQTESDLLNGAPTIWL